MPSFSMPNIMNMFGNNEPAPMQIRPEVVDMMQRQQNTNPPPGMIFGFGPSFSTEAYNQANNVPTGVVNVDQDPMQKAIGAIYNLTGDEAGTLKDTSPTEPGFMERLNNLSGDEMLEGIRGVQGLLDAVSPPQQELVPAKIYSASPGL